MAFAAARMIKEKKNLEAEHKKRSSDGLSKTKSKVLLPHFITYCLISSHLIFHHITSYVLSLILTYQSYHTRAKFFIQSYLGKLNGFQLV